MGLIESVAAKGRNGDTMIAHLTPGEVVVPREVAAMRPDIIAHIGSQLKQMGGDPRSIVAGRGRINPKTGIQEFATQDEVAAAYQQYLGRAPDAEGLAYWSGQNDLSGFAAAAQPELSQRAADVRDAVSSAYQTNFGRDAETAGVDYWTNQVMSGGASLGNIRNAIAAGARNDDIIALRDGAKYETAWRSDINPNTDALTYDAAKDVWNPVTKKVEQPLPFSSSYAPNFNSQVDAPMETIEGRITNLLNANSPVLQQAYNRVQQTFSDRGLLNSSMAQQAGMEAVISKAIEIAGPDAQTYFQNRTNNLNWQNRFAENEQNYNFDLNKMAVANTFAKDQASNAANLNLQSNYQQAIQNTQSQYQQQILALQQNPNMDTASKQMALEGLALNRDNSVRMMTAMFQQFPGWSSEWSKLIELLPSA